jgi:hypothetical protein
MEGPTSRTERERMSSDNPPLFGAGAIVVEALRYEVGG